MIVIDSPAILPFDGDTFIACADRALLIVEWERTEREAVIEALGMLGENRHKVAGAVLKRSRATGTSSSTTAAIRAITLMRKIPRADAHVA